MPTSSDRLAHPALPWLAALAVMLMWASSFIVIRYSGAHLAPGAMALLRMGSAAVVLLPLLVLGRVRLPRTPKLWAAVVAWGLAWFAAYTIILNAAELHIDAATAAMLVNIAPLIVAVVSGLFFGEGLSWRLVLGVVVAFGGIGLITAATSTGRIAGVGVVLGIVAALFYAGCVLAQKRLLTRIDSTSMTVIGIVAGALACLPFGGTLASELAEAPAGSIIAVVYTGIFPTALAFLLWGYALTRMPAGALTSSSLIVPALSLLMAWVLLAEVPPALAMIGGVLCLVGAGFAIVPTMASGMRRWSRARPSVPLDSPRTGQRAAPGT